MNSSILVIVFSLIYSVFPSIAIAEGVIFSEDTAVKSVNTMKQNEEFLTVEQFSQLEAILKNYIIAKTGKDKYFLVKDPRTNNERKLVFEKLQKILIFAIDKVYLCSDFKDADSGDMVNVDFKILTTKQGMDMGDFTIHKINGEEQFAYDVNGEQVELVPAKTVAVKDVDPEIKALLLKETADGTPNLNKEKLR